MPKPNTFTRKETSNPKIVVLGRIINTHDDKDASLPKPIRSKYFDGLVITEDQRVESHNGVQSLVLATSPNSDDGSYLHVAHDIYFPDSERPFSCNVCGNSFSQKANLRKHQLIHTGERPYTCLHCGKAFTQLANLHKHELTHTGIRQFHCHVCTKAFTQRTNLDKHVRIHSGIKPHVCDVCHRGFVQLSNLSKHRLTHMSTKPYCCDICNKSYTQKSNLIKHQKSCVEHTAVPPN